MKERCDDSERKNGKKEKKKETRSETERNNKHIMLRKKERKKERKENVSELKHHDHYPSVLKLYFTKSPHIFGFLSQCWDTDENSGSSYFQLSTQCP